MVLINGMLVAASGLVAFLLVSRQSDASIDHVRTATFCTVAFSQLFFAIGCRSPRRTMPELGLFSNRYLITAIIVSILLQVGTVTVPGIRHIFGVNEMPKWDWWLIVTLALIPVTVIEFGKLIRARVKQQPANLAQAR
jgi:P-type Ca2+ transporter type 2C